MDDTRHRLLPWTALTCTSHECSFRSRPVVMNLERYARTMRLLVLRHEEIALRLMCLLVYQRRPLSLSAHALPGSV